MDSYNPFSLEHKMILISGASSGIGRQCAIDCNRMGATIILLGRDKQKLEETRSLLDNKPHALISYDLNNIVQIGELIASIVSSNGKLDGFVHAAGIERTLPIKMLNQSDYEDLYRVNVISGMEISKHFSNKKYHNPRAKIIFISSISGVIGRTGIAAYSASKGALIAVTKTMALEFASKQINVNCISPGTILTPMMNNYLSQLTKEDYDRRIDGFPLGLGVPSDIANACIYLLSEASKWVTGQNFIVDGGYTAR